MDEFIGKKLGNYELTKLIGKGGMATVYLAYQPSMNRNVAVKIMGKQYSEETSFIQRFKNEAQLIAQLEHAHILPVHDFGEQDGLLYIVMRYMSSGTLEARIHEDGMPLAQIENILRQVASALDYAHSRGVIHRDLKPGNIMLDTQNNTFLSDFGIAKSLESNQNLTATDSVVGTPTYMAPEQGLGEPVDARSDIYALGVILFEMLTGRLPFIADNPMAVMLKHINDVTPVPSSFNPKLSPYIDRVVLKAMEKKRELRYKSCMEMADAFSEAVAITTGKKPAPVSADTMPMSSADPASTAMVGKMDEPGGVTMPGPIAQVGASATAPPGPRTAKPPTEEVPDTYASGATQAAALLTREIAIKLNPLSNWLYGHEAVGIWVQAILLSLATFVALFRLTSGGTVAIALLSLVPGLLLYALLRAPTVGALSSMVLILVPLLAISPGLALIWIVFIVVSGSRLTSREIMLILVTMIAISHPIGFVVPLVIPWWFRVRRVVLPSAIGVLLAALFATVLDWPNAAGLLPISSTPAEFSAILLPTPVTDYIGLFDLRQTWSGQAISDNLVQTFSLIGAYLAETEGMILLIATVWSLVVTLSVSNIRSESPWLRAGGLGIAAILLLGIHIFNPYTEPEPGAIAFALVAVVLAVLVTQWPIQVDPNQSNKIGTALRVLRQSLGAVYAALGISYMLTVLYGTPLYGALWTLGISGVLASITNPLIGPPLAFAGIIAGLAFEQSILAAIIAGLLFVYMGVNFFFDQRRPRRWNPIGAGIIIGAPGISSYGLLPLSMLSIGALEAQVPAVILAVAGNVMLAATITSAGAVFTPLGLIVQLLTTVAGVLVVERLMSLDVLNQFPHKLRRLMFTTGLALLLAISYYILGGAILAIDPPLAIVVSIITAAVFVGALGDRASFWRRFIEREEQEDEGLEDDEVTGEMAHAATS